MTQQIDAIFFDLGATLRILHKDNAYQKKAREMLAELAETDLSPEEFLTLVEKRYEPYRNWALTENRESGDEELWKKWLIPEYSAELIQKNCHKLSYWYRQTKGVRFVVDHGIEVIHTLHDRGYKLGIISNLIGETEIPDWIEADNLRAYFDCVVLSSICHIRKPDPEIYHIACRELNIQPENCASVADNLDRDITGARAVKLGACILFYSPEKKKPLILTNENRPDCIIQNFMELLDLFPQREGALQ